MIFGLKCMTDLLSNMASHHSQFSPSYVWLHISTSVLCSSSRNISSKFHIKQKLSIFKKYLWKDYCDLWRGNNLFLLPSLPNGPYYTALFANYIWSNVFHNVLVAKIFQSISFGQFYVGLLCQLPSQVFLCCGLQDCHYLQWWFHWILHLYWNTYDGFCICSNA